MHGGMGPLGPACRGGVDGPKFNYYADLAMMAQEILKSNKREGRMQASRPGAKAKMAANNVDLWNYLSKSDVQIARQTPSDLAMLKKYAQRALTMPDFHSKSHL